MPTFNSSDILLNSSEASNLDSSTGHDSLLQGNLEPPVLRKSFFSEIEFDSQSSSDDIVIEPLFSDHIPSKETSNGVSNAVVNNVVGRGKQIADIDVAKDVLVETVFVQELDCRVYNGVECNINFNAVSNIEKDPNESNDNLQNNCCNVVIGNVVELDAVENKNIVVDDTPCIINESFRLDVDTSQGKIVELNSVNEKSKIIMDVYILPENLSSYSHCLYLTSSRSKRLRLLREAAIWRTLRLICGWIMIVFFLLWLHWQLFCTFPINPFKYVLREKTKKELEKNKIILPSTCIEELYEFSKWGKFTEGRPKTTVFYQGKTYTYEKLPPYPKTEKRPKSKPVSKRQKQKLADVTSDDSVDSVVNIIVKSLVDNVVASSSDSVNVLTSLFSPISVPVPAPIVLRNSMLNPLASLFVSEKNAKCASTYLRDLRIENIGNIIIAHLNINSLRKKKIFLQKL